MRKLFVATALLVMIPGVARAGGGGVDTSGCAGFGEGTTVVMQDSCFAGTAHFAPAETTITVDNNGQLPHTLTAVDGSFDTGTVEGGSSGEIVVSEPGVYRVFCSLHGTAEGEGMAGVLVVGEAVPEAMAAAPDTSAISAAVASENEAVIRAIEGQESTLEGIDAMQAELQAALDEFGNVEASPAPQVITVAGEAEPTQFATLLIIGLAVGLALASLLTVLRVRIADRRSANFDRFEPSVEA